MGGNRAVDVALNALHEVGEGIAARGEDFLAILVSSDLGFELSLTDLLLLQGETVYLTMRFLIRCC